MEYKIPLFDLNFDKREEEAVMKVLKSKWISTGPKTTEFEQKFTELLDVKYATALTNCTVSLHMALKLLGIGNDDEVICPSLTFVATSNAILYLNAIPVFADIKSQSDLTIDPDDIERKISKKTKAIIVMHYGGFACDMDRIMAIAKKNDLKVIEDTSHAPLSEYKGKKLGTIGDIGCFSFFSNKNISTGEGGMLVCNNPVYYDRSKLLRSHGMSSISYERAKGHATAYDVIDLGYNYRFDDIRASIGLVQLEKLKEDLHLRGEIRSFYTKALKDIEDIDIPFIDYPYFSSNYIFPVVLKDFGNKKRDEIRNNLAMAGIQTSIHYPPVHKFSIYEDYTSDLAMTEYVADNLITLPMYSKLSLANIEFIAENMKKNL